MGNVDLRMTKRGVVLYIEEYDDLDDLFVQITNKFSQLNGFFAEDDKISVMLKDKEKHSKDITEIISFVEKMGFKVGEILVGEMSQNVKQKTLSVKEKLSLVEEEDKKSRMNPTKVIKKTVRSGQAIVHDGDIMLIGNLNDGGEIIAGGNVVVIGEARGVIRAGSRGNEEAIIYAVIMSPELIQIANYVIHLNEPVMNAIAYVRNGKVLVERFDAVKFGQVMNHRE
ncbi:MAG: septum site-determining protein MinC [Mesoaciditoga sp.]|uniref:septum site-determining protein MinC n=1 Tax=Athalassotoga sp. TaxID=2022597 RepID=UPI000CBB43F4|nr:MAG: septum site-determining protein MinC [Mesoaciditoga sp.]HEU24375.1 septum site-determining protein MinC [Mesoaciditoga lauensis]